MQFLSQKQAKRAIAYYRHSAEDKQENSVPIQREHAAKFALEHNIEIIYEAADEGETGLTSDRDGFESLFKNFITNPEAAQFDYVLVYDVTRWGRWQNLNAPAHYEFLFEEKDKKVVYVSRGFPKEGQHLISHLQTSIERYMAADYSRQLSDKVWHGCMRVSRDGFSVGGTSCYGMARLLLDENKQPIRILKLKEHKQISNQRVTFTPLNDETTQVVKDIFYSFVTLGMDTEDIAEMLNEKNIPSAKGGKWNRGKVMRVLTNETYTGTRIYNKTSGKLKSKSVKNPREEWAIAVDAFSAVVAKEVFWQAQERLFWSIRSRWNKGLYMINKTKKFIEKEIRGILVKEGIDEDKIDTQIKKFPLAYSVSFCNENVAKKYTLFAIEEQLKNYEKVLAVSISLDKKETIESVFLIPTSDFNQCNFFLFSDGDKTYSEYKIPADKIYESIMPFVERLQTH